MSVVLCDVTTGHKNGDDKARDKRTVLAATKTKAVADAIAAHRAEHKLPPQVSVLATVRVLREFVDTPPAPSEAA